jgi:hypothetical protein
MQQAILCDDLLYTRHRGFSILSIVIWSIKETAGVEIVDNGASLRDWTTCVKIDAPGAVVHVEYIHSGVTLITT